MKLLVNTTFMILMFLGSVSAKAWTVSCGDRTIYYSSGRTLMTQGGTFYFESGRTMFTQGGTGYFDSGRTFRTQSDTLYYDSGRTIKTQGGTYYYDSGRTARTQGGTLYRENGTQTPLPFKIDVSLGEGVRSFVNVKKDTDVGSDIEITVKVGPSESLELHLSPEGIVCSALSGQTEVRVNGRAGSATIQVLPGFDREAIAEAVRQVLNRN